MNNPGTDRLGIAKLETIFSKVGWFFREQFVRDYGIDAQVEIVENNRPTGQLIAIQIKSGESYFNEVNSEFIIYRPDKKHVDYWINHSLPVIVVLYNPEEDKAYWMPVTNESVFKTESAYKIEIPIKSIIDERNCAYLKKVFRLDVPNYRFNRMLLDLPWMNLVNEGEIVYVEFEDWVNKSLPRTSIKIYCDTNEGHREILIPQHYCPGLDSLEIVKHFVPWADYEMDIESYKEYMESIYQAECYAGHDKESGQYYYSKSFGEWYQEPDGIEPIQRDGEVDLYRVILKLNNLGKSFLNVADYLYKDIAFEYISFSIDEI